MEVGSQLIPLLKAFLWFAPLFLLSCFLSTSVGKGLIGEWRLRLSLRQSLSKKAYRRLHDVSLSTSSGTTQFDHILVSIYGIFLIETKHMRGWIFGQADQKHWTQKFHKKSFRFHNPLHLNARRARTLGNYLGLANEATHSIVCFVGTHRFKSDMPDNVTSAETLVNYIKTFTTPIFTEEEVRKLYKIIQKDRIAPTWESHVQHIGHLKSQLDPSAERVCPECGSQLVLQKQISPEDLVEHVWSCTAFPKCKVTQRSL